MRKVVVASYEAMGGPEVAVMSSDGYTAGPTDAGEYRVLYCGQHSSRAYAAWSKILWGSELREDGKGNLLVKHQGKWTSLSRLTSVSRKDIAEYNEQLYGTKKIPDKWVFNDFGHITCYFYKDKNRDGRFNKDTESIHGEFFHTTPVNEAQQALGLPVVLENSHGCIHLKPSDIDAMRYRGFMNKGNRVVIHRYDETSVSYTGDVKGRAPYELHFYPGLNQIKVIGER
jgi:hypothetical protein